MRTEKEIKRWLRRKGCLGEFLYFVGEHIRLRHRDDDISPHELKLEIEEAKKFLLSGALRGQTISEAFNWRDFSGGYERWKNINEDFKKWYYGNKTM